MIQPSEANNDTGPRRLHTVTVHKESHHAVTSNKSKYTVNYLKVTEHLARKYLEHAKVCDSAAQEVASILKEMGVVKGC